MHRPLSKVWTDANNHTGEIRGSIGAIDGLLTFVSFLLLPVLV
jgi:hypothetical protein